MSKFTDEEAYKRADGALGTAGFIRGDEPRLALAHLWAKLRQAVALCQARPGPFLFTSSLADPRVCANCENGLGDHYGGAFAAPGAAYCNKHEVPIAAAAPSAPAWIAVTQEPDAPVPDMGEKVLFRLPDWPDGSACLGELADQTGMWESEETDDDGAPRWTYGRFEVSHFMRIPKAPLPAPPERTEP